MTLQIIHDQAVFDDASTDEARARVYVPSGELGLKGNHRPEVQLMAALTERPVPQRLHLVGPSGAGKTSLILKVVANLAQRADLPDRHEVLIVRVGDSPDRLHDAEAMMKLVLDTVAVNDHRFSSVSAKVLRAAAADQTSRTAPQVEHRATGGALGASYSVAVKQAFQTETFGQNPAKVRNDLTDVLTQVSGAGYRPVLVLDDTEKFVSPGPYGTLDTDSIRNLYHHGIRALGEMPVDLVVAMHPRFEEVDHVTDVVQRLGMARIEVPELNASADAPPLAIILQRRIDRHEVQLRLDSVIAPAAVEDLQVLYHERNRDLRSVLKLAHAATERALQRNATMVAARDVREAVAAGRRPY